VTRARWIKRGIAAGCVLGAATAIAVAAIGVQLVVEPPVIAVSLQLNQAGSGSATLRNIGDATASVGSIVADSSCASGVTPTASPSWPFTVAPAGTHMVGIGCASSSTYGIRRCKENVLGSGAQILTSYTGLCMTESTTMFASSGSHNFGDVMVGGQSTVVPLTILNSNGNPAHSIVSIQLGDHDGNFKVHSPCLMDGPGCDAPIVVGSGIMFIVNVSCTPQSVGPKTAPLYVVGNGGTRLFPAILLTCNGTSGSTMPAISANPPSVTLSNDANSGMSSSNVTVSNIGMGSLTISGFTKAGSPDWTYSTMGLCQTLPCTLPPTGSFMIDTTFAPTAIGMRNAMLTITSDDPNTPMLQIPLNGTGLGANIALATNLGMPPTLDLGTSPIGIQTTATFDLRNDGNVLLMPVNLLLTQPGTELTVSPNPTTIGASSIRTITVGCTPTSAQLFTAQLDITAPNALTGSPISIVVKCTGTSGSLYATPSSIQLGEVRTGSPRVTKMVALKTAGSSLTISSPPELSPTVADLSVTAPSSAMITLAAPSTFELNVDATADHDLATSIEVTASGDTLSIPVTGKVVTANIDYPQAIMIGSFCVNQSTTGAASRLTSTGTATIGLATQPVMNKMSSSPFQLSYTSPVSYPYSLPPNQSAMVEVTPLRQMEKGIQTDDVVWATDVLGDAAPRTTVTAEFIADGGAIAPQLADFGAVPVRQSAEPKVIKIQNCGMEPMSLTAPAISPGGEFSDDSATPLPEMLAPNAIATINVTFRPTKVGTRMATLTVGSSKGPLGVTLLGQGIGGPGTTTDSTSFYACDCTSSRPTDAWPAVLVLLGLRRRRRR
jgi:hypothetical protein